MKTSSFRFLLFSFLLVPDGRKETGNPEVAFAAAGEATPFLR